MLKQMWRHDLKLQPNDLEITTLPTGGGEPGATAPPKTTILSPMAGLCHTYTWLIQCFSCVCVRLPGLYSLPRNLAVPKHCCLAIRAWTLLLNVKQTTCALKTKLLCVGAMSSEALSSHVTRIHTHTQRERERERERVGRGDVLRYPVLSVWSLI